MFTLTEIVKEDILEIVFLTKKSTIKFYTIIDALGIEIMKGKITGNIQRTCIHVGNLKKGAYNLVIDESNSHLFTIIG